MSNARAQDARAVRAPDNCLRRHADEQPMLDDADDSVDAPRESDAGPISGQRQSRI